MLYYLTVFIFTLVMAVVITVIVRKAALRINLVDIPDKDRKIHDRKIPLGGGITIFLCFFIVLFFIRDKLTAGDLEFNHWLWFFIGALILISGGFLDDKYNLKPKLQIIFPLLATLAVIIGGVNIEKITNPLGGFLYLDIWQIPVYSWPGAVYYFVVLSDILIVLWLMGMMYTTKLLDGIDGLVTGVTAIGGFVIFLFTMTTKYFQPDIGIAALVLAAACLGFLIFNWHPARIFLGEGGSLLLGYILGVLAIISGGKIAIALLIMGLPILDVAWTILRRSLAGKNPFTFADRKHLHFRLLDLGLGQRRTALVYYGFAAIFGLSALFLQSLGKAYALGALLIIMLLIVIGFGQVDKKQIKRN